jgi:tRNASer (uridine44-2'-O)-methyltransferase
MPAYEPDRYKEDARPLISDFQDNLWSPVIYHGCTFDGDVFVRVMDNFVKNPNLNSSWLFRADILEENGEEPPDGSEQCSRPLEFKGFRLDRVLVRRLIPRNSKRDGPLDQTCLFLSSNHGEAEEGSTMTRQLLVYIPHVPSEHDIPFYHPKVRGMAHLHEWNPSAGQGTVSLHFWHFDQPDPDHAEKLDRTALMLLSQLHKHGQGAVEGYVKRVHHDTIIPQPRFQDTYTRLKNSYARTLVTSWAETTDPSKHVFEDLGIAAFLIELWRDMYTDINNGNDKTPFPGFVDIGCGNGLLVYILRREGYEGWGFDARARKSWHAYNIPLKDGTDSLQALALLPSFVQRPQEPGDGVHVHDGVFAEGTFIISNHADELTPWTPILAAGSRSPFIAIPCCSHDLTGRKFRAPPPRDKSKGQSAYASLVAWGCDIAADCGYRVETEMLRIPSTRNTALIGRDLETRSVTELEAVIAKYGGAQGLFENVSKLIKTGPRGH